MTTAEDLEGYWALVEMELTDINNCFSEVLFCPFVCSFTVRFSASNNLKVEKWRMFNYNADHLIIETPLEAQNRYILIKLFVLNYIK